MSKRQADMYHIKCVQLILAATILADVYTIVTGGTGSGSAIKSVAPGKTGTVTVRVLNFNARLSTSTYNQLLESNIMIS